MITQYKDLQERLQSLKINPHDLATDEDLALGVMNLIAIEEHLHYTSQKTGNNEYLSMLANVRQMRVELMKKLLPHTEGEVWCTCKHMLSASMRMMEVGTKYLGIGNHTEAEEYFKKSFGLFTLFWTLKLKMASLKEVSDAAESDEMSLGDIMSKLANCCKE